MDGFYGTYGNEGIPKFFSNLDFDPRNTLKLAETESLLWVEGQVLGTHEAEQIRSADEATLLTIPSRWCFIEGSWKAHEIFPGQEWYSRLSCFDGLMGARNTRFSHSLLHLEVEALIWRIECIRNLKQFNVIFATYCSQLAKMVSELEEWLVFASYLEDIKTLKGSFNSSVIHIPQTQNSWTKSLASSTRKQPSFVCGATNLVCRVYESVYVDDKKIEFF